MNEPDEKTKEGVRNNLLGSLEKSMRNTQERFMNLWIMGMDWVQVEDDVVVLCGIDSHLPTSKPAKADIYILKDGIANIKKYNNK